MLKNFYLIVGPSGSGKSSIIHQLQEKYNFIPLLSYTTRKPRYDGENGYIFVTPEEFSELGIDVAYTKFDDNEYGTTQNRVDNSDLYIVDPNGVKYFQETYSNTSRKVIVIGIQAMEIVRARRMLARGDTPQTVARRLQNDFISFAHIHNICNKVIYNEGDNIDNAVQAVYDYIMEREQFVGYRYE